MENFQMSAIADEGSALSLKLTGAVDIFVAAQLLSTARSLLDAHKDLRIQCAELEHLDASTLQLLAAVRRELTRRGCRLELRQVSPALRERIRYCGLEPAIVEGEHPSEAIGLSEDLA